MTNQVGIVLNVYSAAVKRFFTAPICKSLPHPSLLFVCLGTRHASAAAFLVLSSFFPSIVLRSFNKKERHGKAFQNRARQGETRSSAARHGRCQHDVHG